MPPLLAGADAPEPIGAELDDHRHVGEGLDVVDDGRLTPQAAFGGIGRPHARLAALAFDRVDQRRLLAADEGAGAEADFQVEVEARAEDVLAQQAVAAALRRCAFSIRLIASGYSART